MLSKLNATSGKRFVKKETHPQVDGCDRLTGGGFAAQVADVPVEVSVALTLNCVASDY
jgi:hypothetical protein